MRILDFFGRNKIPHAKLTDADNPSPERAAFAENVLLIIIPSVEKFGFKRTKAEIKTYSTTIVFRKEKQYIKISSTSYPTDYPYYYNIILGEGDSDDFVEYDWNSVSLFELAKVINPLTNVNSYNFPVGDPKFADTINLSIAKTNKDLLRYGSSFLNGDLSVFYHARKKVNESREPYKISKIGDNGTYHTAYDSKSAEQKKKYS